MKEMMERAIGLANDQTTIIVRFDVQFNYLTQQHQAFLTLANGNEYRMVGTYWEKVN